MGSGFCTRGGATMVQRLTFRRRHSYATASNKVTKVKVASGRLVYHYNKKVAKGPRCGDCGKSLPGIPHLRPKEYRGISKRQKNVSRAYGGNKCSGCVRDRVVRAFLCEERKIVKNVLKARRLPFLAARPRDSSKKKELDTE